MLALKRSLLLLGAFAWGYNAAHALHELGHASAMWATGGRVTGVMLHPFSWSKVYYASPPTSPRVATWSGALFAAACGLMLLVLIRRWHSVWSVPLAATALCTLLVNGIYLALDSLFLAGGDPTQLVRLGTPRVIIFLVGMVFIVAGLVAGHMTLPRIGAVETDGILVRILVLQGGIGLYLVAMLFYHLVWNPQQGMFWAACGAAGLLLVTGGAAASKLAEHRWQSRFRYSPLTPSWWDVAACMAAGFAVVACELIAHR